MYIYIHTHTGIHLITDTSGVYVHGFFSAGDIAKARAAHGRRGAQTKLLGLYRMYRVLLGYIGVGPIEFNLK